MILGARVIAVTLVLSLIAGVVPVAHAQAPAQPAPQPEMVKETLKPHVAPTSVGEDVRFDDTFYEVSAGIMTAFLIPGRVVTCGAGGLAALVLSVVTLGTAYRAAAGALREGCGGKWIVHPEDIRPAPDRAPITHGVPR
jgi:hypothetical protein